MTTRADGGGTGVNNQERLRQKLKTDTLAKRLADADDPAHTDELNGDALKRVLENELQNMRRSLEQGENQVS